MGNKESHDAAAEARRGLAKGCSVPVAHADAVARYLTGICYEKAGGGQLDRDDETEPSTSESSGSPSRASAHSPQ